MHVEHTLNEQKLFESSHTIIVIVVFYKKLFSTSGTDLSSEYILTEFCLQSSLNGSASNLPDGAAGRSFATSFSGQSGVASPVFHHSGGKILLESILFLLSFSYIIVRFLLQVLFRDCTTFMGAIMYPICLVHLHQETQR